MDINPYESPKLLQKASLDVVVQADESSFIKYDITLDDVTAFCRHFIANSRAVRNQEYFTIAVICFIAVVGSLSLVPDFGLGISIMGGVASATFFAFLYHFASRYAFVRQSQKTMLGGSTRGILGIHELELEEKYLIERTEVNASRQALSSIDRIEETDDHAFLFVSALQAHVIPKHRLVVGNASQFVKRARDLVAQAQRDVK